MAESWWVFNRTNRVLAIGDLPRVPEIKPGQQVDLLLYTKKQTINQSIDLSYLVDQGMVTLTKSTDADTINEVRSVEVDEMEGFAGLYYTKTEVDDLIGVPHQVYIVNTDPKPGPGNFSTIKAAVDAAYAAGATEEERWVIKVEPGEYHEDEITVYPWIFVKGDHIDGVDVYPNGDHHVFILKNRSGLQNMTISDAPSGKAGIYANDVGNFALVYRFAL